MVPVGVGEEELVVGRLVEAVGSVDLGVLGLAAVAGEAGTVVLPCQSVHHRLASVQQLQVPVGDVVVADHGVAAGVQGQ
jgi:hypothetical protein